MDADQKDDIQKDDLTDFLTENEDGTKTLTLAWTAEVSYRENGKETKKTITELTFRRANGGDLRALSSVKDELGQTMALLSRLTGMPAVAIDKLDLEDIERAIRVIESFLPESLRTGKT